MAKKMKKQNSCNHCGGVLTFNGEYFSCLMCGRDKDHECELCVNIGHVTKSKRPRRAKVAK